MVKIKDFIYTKASGEVSERTAVVVSEPKENYLMLDITGLSPEKVEEVLRVIREVDAYRTEVFNAYNINSLWRSFKPEGIEWKDTD